MSIDYLSEEDVAKQLDWSKLILAMESSLSQISSKTVVQPPRLFMNIEEKKGVLLAMPGFSSIENSLGCKLVTSFLNNKKLGLPSIMATIILFDGDSGKPKAIIEGTTITGWRTAAASVAATKHLHKGKKNILAILGSGTQGKMHALAMQHQFKFKQVKIWSRNFENAVKLCKELGGNEFVPVESGEICVKDADVICTTTYADKPILHHSWINCPQVFINAVGAGINHHSEIDELTYRNAVIITDQIEAGRIELKGLLQNGLQIWGEVGEVINQLRYPPDSSITIFHSLGMAIEDVLAANIVYHSYKQQTD